MDQDMELEQLLKDLREGEEEDRRYAAQDLEDLGDPRAIPSLIQALADSAISVREAVMDALVSIGGEEVCRSVASLLDSEDSGIRNAATEVLQRLPEDSVETCIELLSNPSHDLRKIAVDLLGENPRGRETEAWDAVVRALEDPHLNVAIAACEALGNLGGDRTVEVLRNHLGRHPSMDAAIFFSLAQVGGEKAREALQSVDSEALDGEGRIAYRSALGMLRRESVGQEELP